LRKLALVLVHQLGAAFVHHTRQVGHPDVFTRNAELDQQAQAGQGGCASARSDQFHFLGVFARNLQAVEDGRAHHDGGTVLVVVEDRDLHALAQLALDVEAVGGLDVFEVDAAERGLQAGDDFDQLFGVLLVDFDVEHIDTRELLEQNALALHHWLAGQRANVAQPQHGSAVGDHAHQVAAAGVLEGGVGVLDNFFTRRRDTRRVGQCQIVLVNHLLGGSDGDLAGLGELVVFECRAAQLGTFVWVVVLGRGVLGHAVSPAWG